MRNTIIKLCIAAALTLSAFSTPIFGAETYNTGRDFYDYVRILDWTGYPNRESDSDFYKYALQAKSWLDIGAGSMTAQLDWLVEETPQPFWRFNSESIEKTIVSLPQQRHGRTAVGIAVENSFSPFIEKLLKQNFVTNVKYRHGRYIEDYANGELGKFDLVTDVYGAVSYAPQIDIVFAKALSHLKIGGYFYTNIEHEDSQRTRNGGWNVKILNLSSDQAESIRQWVRGITCATAEVYLGPLGPRRQIVIKIQRTCEAVKVPQLKLVETKEANPPTRIYELAL